MQKVVDYLKSLKAVGIAFSGGVDSSLLAVLAGNTLGNNAHIFTIVTPYMSVAEIASASTFAQKHQLNHHIIKLGTPEAIKNNPKDRCYLCKTQLFSILLKEAKDLGVNYILDGSNADDTKDYRPGMRALNELKIKSPFLELGIGKKEIRDYSKKLNLNTWDTPSNPCLLTRLPYDKLICDKDLRQVEKAEDYLHSKGFKQVRVRHEGATARIELPSTDQTKLFISPLQEEIIATFKNIGFTFIALDLKSFQSGNMNQTI